MQISFFSKLSKREKIILGGGIAFIGGVLLYFYGMAPLRARAVFLDTQIAQKEEAIRTLEGLSEEYQYLLEQTQAIEGRLPGKEGFSPLSYIEQVALKNKVRNKITSIRTLAALSQGAYQETPMEIKMEGLPIADIVPFLAAFEESPNFLRIKRLSLRSRQDEPNMLDMTFVLAFYEKI